MTFEIREPNGCILTVSTVVGDGLTRVVITQETPAEEPSLEPEEA